MNFVKKQDGVAFSPSDTKMSFVFDVNNGTFKTDDWEDSYRLMNEGVISPCTEKDFSVDLKSKINALVVWTERAEDLARERHKGMVDKAGKDYFSSHILPVCDLVRKTFGGGYLPIVAYLHDILEDTETTIEELLSLFPSEVVNAVDALTRRKGESYSEYIRRVKKDPLAVKVKICDLAQNMDPKRTSFLSDEERKHLNRRYTSAFSELMND